MTRAGLKLDLDGTELLELQGPAGETTTQAIANLAGGGGSAIRFVEASIGISSGSISSPVTYWPVLTTPVVGPVFCSIPRSVPASTNFSIAVRAPNDGGADITINYSELTVTNQDATEVLSIWSAGFVLAANDYHVVLWDEFGGASPNVYVHTGTDLSFINLGSVGAILTAAGGVFSVQMSFDITPPA